jgi:hypothetical protein
MLLIQDKYENELPITTIKILSETSENLKAVNVSGF